MSVEYFVESIRRKPVLTRWTLDKMTFDERPFRRNGSVDEVLFDEVSYNRKMKVQHFAILILCLCFGAVCSHPYG